MRHTSLLTLALAGVAVGQLSPVHLQWSICEPDAQTVLRKLGENGTREPYRDTPVTYYDTDPPTYTWGKLMFRTKSRHGQPVSAVKVRFDPRTSRAAAMAFESDGSLPGIPDAHAAGNVKCVWNRYGDDVYFSCGLQSPLIDIHNVWSDEQRLFVERSETVKWDELVGYGPNYNPKWQVNVAEYPGVFDDVQAGYDHFMELEVKVAREEGHKAYEDITKYLKDHGIQICDHQKPRTLRLFETLGYNNSKPSLVVQP